MRRRCSCRLSKRRPAARAASRCRPTRPSSAPTTRCSPKGSTSRPSPRTSSSSSRPPRSASRVMEEATYRGVNVNATVSFSVAQAVAAGEAVERGLRRRESAGLPVDDMGPVITVMMGRLEDWLRVQSERDGIVADPTAIPWSGVAVFKRTVAEFRARGLRARPLGAAIRHHLHWSELIGGDVVITLPAVLAAAVQRVVRRGPAADGRPGRPGHRRRASARFPDFVRAFEPDGLTPDEFDTFGPSARTLRAFVGSYHELLHQVGDALVPTRTSEPRDDRAGRPRERATERPHAGPAPPASRPPWRAARHARDGWLALPVVPHGRRRCGTRRSRSAVPMSRRPWCSSPVPTRSSSDRAKLPGGSPGGSTRSRPCRPVGTCRPARRHGSPVTGAVGRRRPWSRSPQPPRRGGPASHATSSDSARLTSGSRSAAPGRRHARSTT